MVVLLYGKERLLKDEAIADLKAKIFRDPSELDLNFQSFDADSPIHAVLDFLSTAPFLAEKRMAVLRGVDALEEVDAERIAAATLPSTACLVLETEETNVKKNAAVRIVSEKAQVTACHTPFENQMPAWVENRARKKGLALERGLASFLIERIGTDLAALDGVLEALRLFVHPRKNVTTAEAVQLAPSNPDEDVFKLAEFLLEDRKKEALGLVDGLYRSGVRTPEIVAALNGQLERYKKGLAAVAAGRSSTELGEEMRVPPSYRQAFFNRIKNTSTGRLRALQKALLACDEAFKTGQAEERLAVERFVLTS